MKIRWHDKDLWASMEFRGLEGWAKLLYYYMYDIADLAGIVELDVTLAEVFIKTKLPNNIDEIEKELDPFFVRVGKNLFLIKYFIETTQGGSLKPSNPPHVCVFKDMVQRYKQGFTDVVSQVRKWNPALGVTPIINEMDEIEEKIKREPNEHKKKSYEGRRNAILNTLKYFKVLQVDSFPCIQDYNDSKVLEIQETEAEPKQVHDKGEH